jgi:hypothetical protein
MPAELFHTNRNLYKKNRGNYTVHNFVIDSVSDPDPKPDPLVGVTDKAPDPSIIKEK